MVTLPGISQLLSGQFQSVSRCHTQSVASIDQSSPHSQLSDSARLSGDTTVKGTTDTAHPGSSTVCSGEFVSTEGIGTLSLLTDRLFTAFFTLALAILGFAVSSPGHRALTGAPPPFSGHLRSHLGLRRIHV